MTDEEIEAENAQYGDYEYCRECDEYVHPNDYEAHARQHEQGTQWDF